MLLRIKSNEEWAYILTIGETVLFGLKRYNIRAAIFLMIFVILLSLMFGGVQLPQSSPRQASYCDQRLKPDPNSLLGYRDRGDRCEGIYIKDLSSDLTGELIGATLFVVSFTESFDNYSLREADSLRIEWPLFGDKEIRLRAYGLPRRLYYRMDTRRPPYSSSYSWSTDILRALQIPKEKIGLVGRTTFSVDNIEGEIYLPLRISRHGNTPRSSNYQLLLVPSQELKEVFITLAPVNTNGQLGVFIQENKALKYGYYPAGRGIVITISNLPQSGIYYLKTGATLIDGNLSVIEIWFYHSKS